MKKRSKGDKVESCIGPRKRPVARQASSLKGSGGAIGAYDVGYKKPPKHTQFQPRHSGNPKGRKKGTRNLVTDLAEELAEQVEVIEGNQPRRVSKQRALIKSLFIRGIQQKDVRAIAKAFDLVHAHGIGRVDTEQPIEPYEIEIFRKFAPRLLKSLAVSVKD